MILLHNDHLVIWEPYNKWILTVGINLGDVLTSITHSTRLRSWHLRTRLYHVVQPLIFELLFWNLQILFEMMCTRVNSWYTFPTQHESAFRFTREIATGLHGPSVFAPLDSTHFHTNCLNKTLPSHKLISRVNKGSWRCLCLSSPRIITNNTSGKSSPSS